jgi:hypothetical protein
MRQICEVLHCFRCYLFTMWSQIAWRRWLQYEKFKFAQTSSDESSLTEEPNWKPLEALPFDLNENCTINQPWVSYTICVLRMIFKSVEIYDYPMIYIDYYTYIYHFDTSLYYFLPLSFFLFQLLKGTVSPELCVRQLGLNMFRQEFQDFT